MAVVWIIRGNNKDQGWKACKDKLALETQNQM
jgi:hypothetical protein